MELVTLKQFADDQKISYEAVRKQVNRYTEELSGHVVIKNRTQYLDETAVKFLKERRRESPIVMVTMDQNELIEDLKGQIESLKNQLMTAQNELLKEKDKIIELQDEAKKTIEDRAKYTALLEDNKMKEEKLKRAGTQIDNLSRQIKEKDGRIGTIQKKAEDLRRQNEADQKTIEVLRKERDEAQAEAQSFTKSIFGFYRKK